MWYKPLIVPGLNAIHFGDEIISNVRGKAIFLVQMKLKCKTFYTFKERLHNTLVTTIQDYYTRYPNEKTVSCGGALTRCQKTEKYRSRSYASVT